MRGVQIKGVEYSLGKEESFRDVLFPDFPFQLHFPEGRGGILSLLSFDEQGHCVGLFYDGYLCARLIYCNEHN